MGLRSQSVKIKKRILQLIEGLRKRFNDDRVRKNLLLLLIAVGLLTLSLTLFLILRDADKRGTNYGVPADDGVLSLHTRVHRNSPLYAGVLAFQQGYRYRAIDAFKQALKGRLSDPEKKTILNYLGNLYFGLRRFDEAAASFRKSLSVEDENAPALHGLGRIAQLRGDRSKAIRLYTQALSADKKFVKSMRRLGDIYFKFGDISKARSYYLDYLAIRKSAYVRYLLGNCYLKTGDRLKAKSEYQRVLDLSNKKILLAYASARLADIFDAEKKVAKAVQYYRQAVTYYPAKKDFAYNLAVLVLKSGNVSEAVRILEQLTGVSKGRDKSRIARILGELYYDSGKVSRSLHYFKKAVEDERNADLFSVIADLYYIKKQYKKALFYYQKVITIFPGTETENTALVNLGNIYTYWVQYDKALEFYKRALNKNKKNGLLYYNIGVVFWKKQIYNKAANNFIMAYQLDPTLSKALRSAERAYIASGQIRKALLLYTKLIETSRRPAAYLYSRAAKIHFLMENYGSAIRFYKNALLTERNKNKREEIYLGLAKIFIVRNRLSEAYSVLKQAFSLRRTSPMCHYLYGRAYLADKRFYRAEEAFRNALSYHPWPRLRAEIIFNLANIAFSKGNYSSALKQYKQVLEAVPGHVKAAFYASQCVKKLAASKGGE